MPIKRLFHLFLLASFAASAQDFKETNAVEINYFTGNIMPHSPDLHHFLAGHPEGMMISFLKQTHGDEEWHQPYNFPDYGLYFLAQDFKNPILGKNYGIGFQYNFYLLKRKLQIKVSQGIGMTTNPHDNETNYRNSAFGTKFMENTNFGLNYRHQNIIDRFGIQAGMMFTHFSNGRIKSPNSGVNTYNINIGVNYNFEEPQPYKIDTVAKPRFTQPIKYNIVLRSGINESLIIGSGQRAFYHPGFYIDKRISRKSAFQAGVEVFFSNFMKGFIEYKSGAYPELNIDPDTDWKRAGVFIGYEMFVNRLSFEAQLGYYIYLPYKTENVIYDRVGVKYYLSEKIFAGVSVKTHGFLAEAMEFNIGARL